MQPSKHFCVESEERKRWSYAAITASEELGHQRMVWCRDVDVRGFVEASDLKVADRNRKNRNQPGSFEVSDVNDVAWHDGREHSFVTLTRSQMLA